ncbi:MAG TPA: EamA family transporter [Afipia sp.]|uniref:DMT family transporter n=1 Tax=unclassified Afipia TaxID=2642050 RepID=UPI000465987F|nr:MULTISPECIES: EamA family transporter [unclassified Afipia]MAH70505.1 EamA family transporter [Afipia sp.]OUX60325.1 MAG: EamA family transporter [Afipia sp. TMED4]HAO39472.1 EamA family transporter [Afipia sp.]HAP11273.1 EamA family transporter [Afipia sp.]HAQ91941.1 EamA family transporter [Afipia sp.]
MTLAIETPRSRTATNLVLLVLLATLWGAAYTLVKIGVETIPPLTFISGRTLIAGGILLAIMRLRGITLPRDPVVWKRFMIQACLNSVVPFTLIAYAETHVGAGLATILGSNAPIFAFLLALLFVRHERPTLRQSFGVAAGLTGICLVVGVDALNGLGQDVIAQLALVLSAVMFGAAALFGRNFNGLDPMVPAAGSMICGAVMLTPLSLIVDRPWTLTPSAASVAALIALAAFSTALAFVIYFRLIQTLGSVGTTAQAYLRVPLGVGLGVVALGETLSPTVWIGLVCVIVGIAAMTIPQRTAGSS